MVLVAIYAVPKMRWPRALMDCATWSASLDSETAMAWLPLAVTLTSDSTSSTAGLVRPLVTQLSSASMGFVAAPSALSIAMEFARPLPPTFKIAAAAEMSAAPITEPRCVPWELAQSFATLDLGTATTTSAMDARRT